MIEGYWASGSTEGIPTASEGMDRVGHLSIGVYILKPMTESWSLTQYR